MPGNRLGAADAPVTIVEFGDFGCPSCRAWHNAGVKDQLMATYGDQVSFVFRHFPVITSRSPRAAEATQCASEQGQFWAYHDYLYESAPHLALSDDELRDYATSIGVDTEEFEQCLEEGRYRSYVSRDQQAALSSGARGTPTFFINGQQVGFSFEAMATVIEQELAR
ncbi:MAG: thioredoxin domain-containing protein [Candidatus Promineifilaceae bacterium]|nr:thioredoxin domain-containing protein [Candidatus Promineifilaceae bacterium]